MIRWILAVITVTVGLALFFEWDTFNPESIRRKRVLITGASSGIGEQLAYQYSKFGASVVITARRAELLEKTARKCKQLGTNKVEYVVADMVKAEDRQRVIREVETHLGGLDHLILNHGKASYGPWLESADNMTRLQNDMEVNFVSFVDIASQALNMLTKSKGSIGVVSSLAGKIASPLLTPYASSKFAIHGFFNSLRQELNHRKLNVSITVFVLGYIRTDMAIEMMETNFKAVPAPKAASVEDTALIIVKGVASKLNEISYPFYTEILLFVHKLIPNYVEYYFGHLSSL